MSLRARKLPQHLHRLCAPTSTSLNGQHHKLAFSRLWTSSGYVFSFSRGGLLQHNSVPGLLHVAGLPLVRSALREERHRSPSEPLHNKGKSSAMNFDSLGVLSCHLHVHVLQEHVLSRTSTCFAEKAADHPFNGSGPLLHSCHFGCKTVGDGPRCREELGIPHTALR